MPKRSPAMLAEALSGPQPLTLPQLQVVLHDASPATTFRYLRQLPYLRSYNENGRYCTLFDPQRFDSFGLLSLGTVRFSQDRSLIATVPRLVNQAEAGWTDKELRSLLHVPVHGPLLAAVRRGLIQREPIHGVFVYLSADGQAAHSQRTARLRRMGPASDLDPWQIIHVLLALLRHPNTSLDQLARLLRGHSPPIRLPEITAVLAEFDLEPLGEKRGPAHC